MPQRERATACRMCGGRLDGHPVKGGPVRLFCSKRCRWRWHNKGLKKRTPQPAVCVVCGTQFVDRKWHGKAKTCGATCLKVVRRRNQVSACEAASLIITLRRAKSKRWRTCEECGKRFLPQGGVGERSPKRFCSRRCYALWQSRTLTMPSDLRAERDEARREERARLLLRLCRECGKEFEAPSTRRWLCSDECQRSYSIRQQCAKEHPKRKVVCRECERRFLSPFRDKHRIFCSDICDHKYHRRKGKATRRARKRGVHYESFDPREIFERDGWICRLCGIRTPRRLCGSLAERAPVMDHIVPLALGGGHTKRNGQCLCRRCNQRKSATIAGQLRLFG
jgi:hypothetical protein